MNKKKMTLAAISIILIVFLFLIYWFYFSKPTAFPKDEQLVEQINQIFPQAKAITIQDTIKLDQEHVFVPFISSANNYGASYWEWKKHKWKPTYIDTTGEPIVWMIDREDPTSFHIVWNVHPDDQISYANFYLIRERNYHITYGEHSYIPRIQMEKNMTFEEKSYGTLKLPDDWLSFMTQANKSALAQNPHTHFTSLLPVVSSYIGWMPFNTSNELIFPENSVNGHGYANGDIYTDFIRLLDEVELEK